MPEGTHFQPEWASAPGETISDILKERKVAIGDFAVQLRITPELADRLLSGRARITVGLAQLLENVLGGSATFWLRREDQYRKDLAHLNAKTNLHQETEWLRELPLTDMVKFGWIKRYTDLQDQLSECFRFFSVSDINEWEQRYKPLLQLTAFRISRSVPAQPAAVAA